MKKMRVGAKIVTFYTISEVARAGGKSPAALRKLIERGLMPEANFRAKGTVEDVPGTRLYSSAIYEQLTAWLQSVKRGRKITEAQSAVITQLFASERSLINKLP